MLFNSYEFILGYLPIAFFVFFWIARRSRRSAALWLVAVSVFFYGWWNPKFVVLLMLSILFNYGAGFIIGHSEKPGLRRTLLTFAIVCDLVLLGIFKYANFFIETLNTVGTEFDLVDIVLPLGISFFTFTQIAFLVDVYRKVAREYDFVHYVLFVTWFPHLIAGPVLHHKQMMPQFGMSHTYKPDTQSIAVGLTLFTLGLFKKVVLADQFADFANPVFDTAAKGAQPMLVAAWVGSLAYTLQLYFDFSGYSDMAIGLSRMFNIKLPLNFDSPYKASCIIDFWRRWHMTLSSFLRDYLYIPLGGSKNGKGRRHLNLLATMLLGGLWHGSGWNFVLWGALHGVYLILNHTWRWLTGGSGKPSNPLVRSLSILLTFLAVVFAWVPFRATNMDATAAIWQGMIGLNGISLHQSLAEKFSPLLGINVKFMGFMPGVVLSFDQVLLWLLVGLFIIWFMPNTQQWLGKYAPAWDEVKSGRYLMIWQPSKLMGVLMGVVFTIAVLFFKKNSPFLYFQF